MVKRMASGDTTRPARDVGRWIANTRKDSHRMLGEVEQGVHRAVDELSASIAARSGPDDLAPLSDIQIDTAFFLATVLPMLEDLSDQLARSLAHQLQSVEAVAAQRGGVFEASFRAARTGWTSAIRAQQMQVAEYLAGYVEGGGLALALLTDLPPDQSGHVAQVSEVLAARVAFVPKRAEAGVTTWLSEIRQELEELLQGVALDPAVMSAPPVPSLPPEDTAPPAPAARSSLRVATPAAAPTAAPVPAPAAPAARQGPDPATALAALMEQARALGVRIRNVPDVPTEQYVARLGAQLAQVEAKREAHPSPGGAPRVSLELLLQVADTLGVRLKEIPQRPSDLYLEKLQAKLVEVSHRKGIAVPLALGTPQFAREPAPADAPSSLDNSPTTDNSSTANMAPEVDAEYQARIASLTARAIEANLDLGRIPVDPTPEWIAATEGKLKSAIDRRNAERRAEHDRRDAERQVQLDRLTSMADRLGVELRPPKFPTDEWLARAELRIASLLLAPSGAGSPVDAQRSERFNRIVVHAADANVDLGELPSEPDDAWMDWAEEMVDDATGAHTIVFEADAAASAQKAWLVFEEGTVQEHQWPITADAELTIGRGRGNTVQIRNDAGVSRRHCTVRIEGGTVVVRDEGSTKGVVVDGQQMQEAWLRGGEQIVLGETLFVFRMK